MRHSCYPVEQREIEYSLPYMFESFNLINNAFLYARFKIVCHKKGVLEKVQFNYCQILKAFLSHSTENEMISLVTDNQFHFY